MSSFELEYSVKVCDDNDFIHNNDCTNYTYLSDYDPKNCDCKVFKQFSLHFTTFCGQNLLYKFETIMIFHMNISDKKNLKKFIKLLKLNGI